MDAQKPRELNEEERREILALQKDKITLRLMRDYFAAMLNQDKPRFNTYDKFKLPANTRFNNSEIETTVGRYIFNLAVLPESYLKKYGYFNEPTTKGALGKIEKKMGEMILNDEMSVKEFCEYLDYGEWLGMGCVHFLAPTMDYEINAPIKEVIEKRDELFEKYADGIKKGDSAVAEKIEKEVVSLAKEKLEERKIPGYDFFKSGIGSFENNYKKTSIMAGAIENPYTKKLDILKSNYIDGSTMEDYSKMSNLTLVGGYSRGVATQVSGYQRKKIDVAVQNIVIDESGTDCGTKYTLDMEIPEGMESLFTDRYIVENNELKLLTSSNIKEYVGKRVKLRSPMFCKSPDICNKCAGELFYKLGVRNAGLLNDTMSGVLMNASMKKFHDATVKFNKIEVGDYIKKR